VRASGALGRCPKIRVLSFGCAVRARTVDSGGVFIVTFGSWVNGLEGRLTGHIAAIVSAQQEAVGALPHACGARRFMASDELFLFWRPP
jgi:hypothetical protein